MKAVVLAKKSERLPGKHMQLVNDNTLIGMVVDKLHSSRLFEEIIVFTKDPDVRAANAEVIIDETEGTALDAIREVVSRYGEIFVVAGDMPLIDAGFISSMLKRYDGMPLFPLHLDGSLEPLHGIYNRKMLLLMEEYLETGKKSLRGFLERCTFDTIKIGKEDENSFFNVNYESDMEKLRKELKA